MRVSPYFFPLRVSNPTPKATLYIFHYSGGGASSFRPLIKELDSSINVIGIQLPGRENRFQEPYVEDLEVLVQDLSRAFQSNMTPNAIFLGHSMGGGLAYECVNAMRLKGISLPKHLIVSGRRAPHRPRSDVLRSDLTDKEMVEVLNQFGGLNDEIMQNEEVLSFILPLMRADLKVLEQLTPKVGVPLNIPITAIGGSQDSFVLEEDLQAWKQYTTNDFNCQMFEGGHFFLLKESLNSVAQLLNTIVGSAN
jgi:medium-chain acyl-[acyl-carrier-protein] hydrolase